MHLQLWAYDDDRTCGVVYTLTEEVLTEASLLPLQAIREGLERTIVVRAYGARLTGVVEERVNRLLEHTLLVAKDHLRSLNLDHAL